MLRTSSQVALVVCSLALPLVGCSGGDDDTKNSTAKIAVLDPTKEQNGKSYSEWNAEWYKWLYGIQFDEDCKLPVDDSTGAYCDEQQNADVFFLAGSIAVNQTVVVRDDCVVAADKPLFFPIMNTAADNGGVPPEQQFVPEDNRTAAQSTLDKVRVSNLFASVDGTDIPHLERFKTDVTQFSYNLPDEPNFYTCLGASGVTGTIDPSFAGGYYVMLQPLTKGSHEIRFGIDQPDDLYSIDVTYHFDVQ